MSGLSSAPDSWENGSQDPRVYRRSQERMGGRSREAGDRRLEGSPEPRMRCIDRCSASSTQAVQSKDPPDELQVTHAITGSPDPHLPVITLVRRFRHTLPSSGYSFLSVNQKHMQPLLPSHPFVHAILRENPLSHFLSREKAQQLSTPLARMPPLFTSSFHFASFSFDLMHITLTGLHMRAFNFKCRISCPTASTDSQQSLPLHPRRRRRRRGLRRY